MICRVSTGWSKHHTFHQHMYHNICPSRVWMRICPSQALSYRYESDNAEYISESVSYLRAQHYNAHMDRPSSPSLCPHWRFRMMKAVQFMRNRAYESGGGFAMRGDSTARYGFWMTPRLGCAHLPATMWISAQGEPNALVAM